jgi:hypothetical protein
MAKPLVLQFAGADLAFQMWKVDRDRLYGWVDVEALDDRGKKCELVALADDGRTLVGRGGSAFGMLSQDGEWLDRKTLKPVDREGKPITPVPSTFAAAQELTKKATIEEYLSHNIKAVYTLTPDACDAGKLFDELKKGAIYTFPFSFRGGLEADAAFLIANPEGVVFLALGGPTKIEFVGLEQVAPLTEDETEEAEDEMDFGML